jgi:hypothetical protein
MVERSSEQVFANRLAGQLGHGPFSALIVLDDE